MKTGLLSALALLSLAGTGAAAHAQDEAAPPPPVQEQANPQGPGLPTAEPPAPVTAEDPVPPAMPADPAYRGGPYKGALTPPPQEEMGKTYPVCTQTIRDSCRNRGGK